jgi:DNA repair protein SbcC/Rad50
MTLISRLFKKKPAAKSLTGKKKQATAQKQSIDKLDQMSADELVNIAVGDNAHELRLAAIDLLPYGEALKNLAFSHNASKLQVSARRRIAALIDSKALRFDRLSNEISDKVALLAVAGLSEQVDLQEQVLDEADEQDFYCKVALEGVSVKLRQAAVQRITQREYLEKLLKQCKGKDKTIYRIVKEKFDAYKAQDKQKQQLKESVESLCLALERLSTRAFDPMFTANFNHLKEQWATLKAQVNDQAGQALTERIERALSACEGIVTEQVRVEAEQAHKEQMLANAISMRESILDDYRQLVASLYVAEQSSSDAELVCKQTLEQMQQRWNEVLEHVPAKGQQQAQYTRLSEAVFFLQEQLQHRGPLGQQLKLTIQAADQVESAELNDSAELKNLRHRMSAAALLPQELLPPLVDEALTFIQTWDQKKRDQKEAVHQFVRQVGGLIRRAGEAIDRGQVRQGVGIRRSIEEKLAGTDDVPSGLSDQLNRLDEKLERLQDWRSYAVQPKMDELVQQMRALIDTTLNPETLAEKIKHLQEQWKQLSKGGGSQYQQLWDSFHELAQTAYEPCKAYFQDQADIRQLNLQKRKDLVTQLEDFFSRYDWESSDWKMIEKMIRVARQEWREYSPTDRSATKPVQAAFDNQLDTVHQHLDVEYKRNAAIKQQLVDQAAQLVDHDDTRSSIDEVKKLQAKWKIVGVTTRKVDQTLWKMFRAHCDAVFEKRQQQSERFKAQLNESKDQAQALCAEVDALSHLSGKALLDARADVEKLQGAFNDLGEMPKSSINAIRSKFSAAIEQFEEKICDQRKQAKEKVWSNLFDASAAVAAYALSVSRNEAGDADRESVQSLLESVELWPKGAKEAVEKKLAGVCSAAAVDCEANEAALRELCIRMEILAGADTPEADQAIRMGYQVKRLQQGLGQNVLDVEATVADLIFEWIAVGPVETALYDQLLVRFDQSRKLISH